MRYTILHMQNEKLSGLDILNYTDL